MEGSIGKRYIPEKPILPLPRGMIYLGKDLSLNRHVIMYGVDSSDEPFAAQYIRQLREASQFTGENFMHILDLGIDSGSNRLMAILKPCHGKPLIQEIGRRTLGFEENVRLVCELGTTMQKAYAEGIPPFSVHADNLWLNEEMQIVVMNYWEKGPSLHSDAVGLCGLLYQLMTGAQTIPESGAHLEMLLRESLRELPPQQLEDVMRLIRAAYTEALSLQEFVFQLRQQLSLRGEQAMSGWKPAASEAQAKSYVRPPIQIAKQEREEKPSQTAARPAQPETRANTAAKRNTEDELLEEATITMELEAEDEEKRSFGWIAKRVLIYGTAAVGIVVLAGFILIGLIDNHKPNRGDESTFAEQTPPTPQTQPQATTTPKDTKPDTATAKPPSAGEPVQAPSLIGLTREQAEKQALASGLHYEFVIEANSQPNNTVFKQDPLPNTSIKSGDNIKFWVSKGQ